MKLGCKSSEAALYKNILDENIKYGDENKKYIGGNKNILVENNLVECGVGRFGAKREEKQGGG